MLHGIDNGLSVEQAKRGFRPARAVIDLPAESAISFLANLAAITTEKIAITALIYSVNCVEYLHIFKQKRNVKTMAAGRVSPNPNLLAGYREIVTPKLGVQPLFRNSLFRRSLLLALLDGTEWYRPLGKVLALYDIKLLLRNLDEDSEHAPPQFATDVESKLRYLTKLFNDSHTRLQEMPEAERPKIVAPLPVIVNRVVRNYLLTRTSEKTGVRLDSFESDDKFDWSKVPDKYNKEKFKIAMSLMYEFRSRNAQAFVEHFAKTFFSITQRLIELDRLELAAALTEVRPEHDRRDDLKILTLLSLSANS